MKRSRWLSVDASAGQVLMLAVAKWSASLHKPTVVVLDNASFHKSKIFKANIAKWANRGLTLLYLPPYSPQLNIIAPQEYFLPLVRADVMEVYQISLDGDESLSKLLKHERICTENAE